MIIKKLLKFEKVALIIGFIVDSIAIASIIGAIKSQELDVNLSRIITPGVAFGIWILAFYTCIAILHSYWQRERNAQNYEDNFGLFLLNDLVWRFIKPFILLPVITLIVLLWGIAYVSGPGFMAILIIFSIIGGVILVSVRERCLVYSSKDEGRAVINKQWDILKKRIESELAKRLYLTAHHLEDLCPIWNISKKNINDALIRYAAENLDTVTYDDYQGLSRRR